MTTRGEQTTLPGIEAAPATARPMRKECKATGNAPAEEQPARPWRAWEVWRDLDVFTPRAFVDSRGRSYPPEAYRYRLATRLGKGSRVSNDNARNRGRSYAR